MFATVNVRARWKRQPSGTLAVVVSFLLAAAASTFWLLAPAVAIVSGGTATTGAVGPPPPPPSVEVDRQTLLEQSGDDPQTMGMLALPVALAALTLALNGTRLRVPARAVAAALLLTGSILAGFSIGLPYLPSALAMTVAAILGTSSTAARQRP